MVSETFVISGYSTLITIKFLLRFLLIILVIIIVVLFVSSIEVSFIPGKLLTSISKAFWFLSLSISCLHLLLLMCRLSLLAPKVVYIELLICLKRILLIIIKSILPN